MAKCKYCGEWCGVAGSEHVDCAALAEEGKSTEEIKELRNLSVTIPARSAKPLSVSSIFWAVFAALWCFTVTAGILYSLLRSIGL